MRREQEIRYDFTNPATRNKLKAEQRIRFKSRQSATATIKVIAELFNVGFINYRVMALCMKNLLELKEPTELDIECFHILITTVGEKLEAHPFGAAIVDKYLGRLEDIIDCRSEEFCLGIRQMIFDIFELRATAWKSSKAPETEEPLKSVTNAQQSELMKEAKATRAFLKELNDVLRNLQPEKFFSFMMRFIGIQFGSVDRLDGSVKVIFEHAISTTNFASLYAFICHCLADVSTEDRDQKATFKHLMVLACKREIDSVRQNASMFRQFCERFHVLKDETNNAKAQGMKISLEKDVKWQTRAVNATTFIAELFNVGFIESLLIFDFFTILSSAEAISNVSIECFINLLQLVAPNMIAENNRNVLLKDSINKLLKAARTIEQSQRVRFLIKDLIKFARSQLTLPLNEDLAAGLVSGRQISLPWSSSLKQNKLWESNPPKNQLNALMKTASSNHHQDCYRSI